MPGCRWLPDEDDLLRKVWMTPGKITDLVEMFPGRTEDGVAMRALRLGLGNRNELSRESSTWVLVKRFLAHGPNTVPQIAEAIGAPMSRVNDAIRSYRKEVYIFDYGPPRSGGRMTIWALGNKRDKKRPPAMSAKERSDRYFMRLKSSDEDKLERSRQIVAHQKREARRVPAPDFAAAWMMNPIGG